MEVYIPGALVGVAVLAIFFAVWQHREKSRNKRQSTTLDNIPAGNIPTDNVVTDSVVESPNPETAAKPDHEDLPLKQPKSRNKGKRRLK